MNWFQFVFLREDSQENPNLKKRNSRCELISICIFTWGFTSLNPNTWQASLLWIDFNLYFYVRIHKDVEGTGSFACVVNWFQFVFLREDSQVVDIKTIWLHGCELISICIFTWGFTSNNIATSRSVKLWIDFNLYFYVRIHK